MKNNATKRFIEVAIEGRWKYKSGNEPLLNHWECGALTIEEILIDPLAWQAVGKVLGWRIYHNHKTPSPCFERKCDIEWQQKQLQLIKHIQEASLKPNFDMSSEIEVYLSTLFKE